MSDLIQKYDLLKQAAALAAQESKDLTGISKALVEKAVVQTVKQYQKKLAVGIEDSVTDLLGNFRQSITESIVDYATTWKAGGRTPFLFPRNCRYCFTKNELTVVVVEQEPQTRSVSFDRGMIEEEAPAQRIVLAFPYVVFILLFHGDSFRAMTCGWRTSPLVSLDDALSLPVLPNVHENGTVCLGNSNFQPPLSSAADNAVGYFWTSRFNKDLSLRWWKKNTIDSRIATGRIWADNTSLDPLFILSVNFPTFSTVNDIIRVLTLDGQERNISTLRHTITERVDACASRLFSKITQYVKKTKFEKHVSADIEPLVRNTILELISQFTDVVFVVEQTIRELEQEIERKKCPVVRKGPFWIEE